jgi:hypothetical protein
VSKRRKANSGDPRRSKVEEAKRAAALANLKAQRDPTHENLARAFALQATANLVEAATKGAK